MNKKKILLTIFVFILFSILCLLIYILSNRIHLKNTFENNILSFASKNEKSIFKINKIIFFSSCDAKNKTASNTNFTIENLYQYTDIALFISGDPIEKNLENTLKSVSLNNIKFNSLPNLGNPKLYYKNVNNFAKSTFNIINEQDYINNELNFNISSEDEANLDEPTLYNNLSNPITLSYVNSNIKSDYTITDTTSPITYDGSLLKKCNVLLDNIACQISFDILITNNLNQKFKSTIYLDIPLQTDTKSIFDGSIILKQDTDFIFYRYD